MINFKYSSLKEMNGKPVKMFLCNLSGSVYCRLVTDNRLESLKQMLSKKYDSRTEPPTLGQSTLAKWQGEWYRATVSNQASGGWACHLVDLGWTVTVACLELADAPVCLRDIPVLAIPCKLSGINLEQLSDFQYDLVYFDSYFSARN